VVTPVPRHVAMVRVTHWITVLCFLALLFSGGEILLSHPRFYWGETGNVLTPPLLVLPLPASRATVPTGFDYVLPDQNGWSRALHFQTAWILALTGFAYVGYGLALGYFRNATYYPLQKLTYRVVIFALFPMVMWTGLAMSPGFVSIVPASAELLGGQESARTIHFFVTLMLVVFLVGHVAMVWMSGFRARMRGMI
jgi:thiosulfate reductase cytochrome b subunit